MGLIFIFSHNICSQVVMPLSTTKDLESLRDLKKGNVVLVNFWATWCKPCIAEFPELVKIYNEYSDKGVEIIFISVDAPEDVNTKVVPFLNDKDVDFVTYYNNFTKPEDLINFFDIKWEGAIPTTYIYNKDWKQADCFVGIRTYDQFEKTIAKLINKD